MSHTDSEANVSADVWTLPVVAAIIPTGTIVAYGCLLLKAGLGVSLMSLHAMFASTSFLFCMIMGSTSYRIGAFRAAGSIPSLRKLRRFHTAWQIAALLFAIAALTCIILDKLEKGHPIFKWPSSEDSYHGGVGWLALSLTAFQSFLGVIKTQSPRRTIPWHGRFGLFVIAVGVLACILGAYHTFIAKRGDYLGGVLLMFLSVSSYSSLHVIHGYVDFPASTTDSTLSSTLLDNCEEAPSRPR